MIKGYKLRVGTVFGLPRDPFRWEPKNQQFPAITAMSRDNITQALRRWIDAKSEWGADEHPGDTYLEEARSEVKGITDLFLGCIEELYFLDQQDELFATRLVGQDYRLPIPRKKV